MQDHSGESNETAVREEPGTMRLRRLLPWARLAIVWERIWPVLVGLSCLAAVFLILSWLGLWLDLPSAGRIAALAAFGVVLLGLLVWAARIALPTRAEALARLDRESGLPHRPASALSDSLANPSRDPATGALWRLHQRRLQAAAVRLKLRLPSPRLAARDVFALRAAILLALVAAGFFAGPEKVARVAAAFDWTMRAADAKGSRVDAWIDPPPYTAKPPVLLSGDSASAGDPAVERAVSAPVGSTLVVRTSGGSDIAIDADSGLTAAKPAQKAAADDKKPASGNRDRRWTVTGDAKLVMKRDERPFARFAIRAVPDQPPTIALNGMPSANARGSLTLSYTIHDDYGVNGAEANFSNPYLHGKPAIGRSLTAPPKLTLGLPDAPGGLGTGQTTADLSDHPWAGERVTMVLSARDDGGNQGMSAPSVFVLPRRPFSNPLARALVEQRRDIVLAPDDRAPVVAALDGLLIAPALFTPNSGIYLGLYSADARLKHARTDDDLRDVADLLWAMALRIEDGDLSGAERDLRAAEQNLRDAMQRGASSEEIAKLTKDLRAALDKFLAQMAEKAARDKNQQARDGRTPTRMVTPKDLQSMLDRLDQMAKSGDLADAQRMLDQLQDVLENLRNVGRNGSSDPMEQAMEQSLDELDTMTRDQQKLRDDTFRDGQRAKRDRREQRRQGLQGGQQPDIQDDDDDDADSDPADPQGAAPFQQRQDALRQQLDELRERMKRFGMGKEQGLDDAEGAMSEAGKSLKQGQRGAAVEAQGRAIDGLRRGAQGFAQQMQGGSQTGRGEGQPEDRQGSDQSGDAEGNRQADRDPLDRPTQDRRSMMSSGPLNGGASVAQRAQQVLDELRKRLSDPSRPPEETDYLERLLRHY